VKSAVFAVVPFAGGAVGRREHFLRGLLDPRTLERPYANRTPSAPAAPMTAHSPGCGTWGSVYAVSAAGCPRAHPFGAAGKEGGDPDVVWPRVVAEVSVSEPLGAAMHERSRRNPPSEAQGRRAAGRKFRE
jgi:hypothetical protein